MTIVLALAVVAVLATIVVLAMGMGGELGGSHPDHPPLPLPGHRELAGTDIALLRLPVGLVGYHTAIANEALRRVATELTERDTRIAVLEQRLAAARQRLAELGDGAGEERHGAASSASGPGFRGADHPADLYDPADLHDSADSEGSRAPRDTVDAADTSPDDYSGVRVISPRVALDKTRGDDAGRRRSSPGVRARTNSQSGDIDDAEEENW